MSAVAAFMAEGLFQHNQPRYYEARYDGLAQRLTSVTTAIDALKKPALVWWATDLTARAAINHLDKLVENVGAFGKEPTLAMLVKLADQERDQAASRGTDVHAICAAIVRGEPVHETEEQRPYVDGFRAWLLAKMPRIVESETMGANLTEGYGGTLDLIVKNKANRHWMIDIKTAGFDKNGKGKGPYPETGLQLAGYNGFEFLGKPNDPTKYPLPECSGFAVLMLRPDGRYEFVPYAVDAETYAAFLAALRVSMWLQGQSKTIIRRVV